MQKLKKTGKLTRDGSYYLVPKSLVFSFFLILLNLQMAGQKFTASVNKNHVAADETFQLQFSVDGAGSGFQAPPLNDFDIISGPNASQSMQVINGNMSQSVSYSFFLRPRKEGRITIAPASINASGKRLESNSITIDVGKAGTASKNNAQGSQGQPAKQGGENLFVRTTLSKSKIYLGESVTITHKVYTRINLVGFQNAKVPSYTGFWSQEIPNQNNYNVTKETLNGILYSVVEFKKTFLFPQRSGTLEIDPVEIDCVVRQQSRNQDPWSIFSMGTEDVQVKIKSQAAHIEVMPLPESGKPQGFSGAVGQFTLKTQLNKDKVKTNEAVNLSITVSGKGNISLIEPPKLSIPADIESYDPKFSENLSVKSTGVEGTKSGEYVLIPRQRGTYKIDALTFSYFDPEKKSYFTLHSPDFSLTVEKGAGDTSAASLMSPLNSKKEVAVVGSDIRFIKTGPVIFSKKGDSFFGSPAYIACFLIPGTCFLLFVILWRRSRKEAKDIKLVKSRQATRMAKKRLRIAEGLIRENDKERFYSEISRTLYAFLSDKLSLPVADLSRESISNSLSAHNVQPAAISGLLDILNICEYARYAPSAVSGDPAEVYDRCLRLIPHLDEKIIPEKKH